MKVFYLGTAPKNFLEDNWPATPLPLYDQPMFMVDALFVFPNSTLEVESRHTYQLVERTGRPIVRVGAVQFPLDRRHMPGNLLLVAQYATGDALRYQGRIADRPRTNYVPVGDELIQQIDQCVASGIDVRFTLRKADGLPMNTSIAAVQVKSIHQEDYVQLADNCWFRLDRVMAINGKKYKYME